MSTDPVSFAATARLLHWLMAAMVLTMLFIGVGMVTSESPRYHLLLSVHKPLGIAILVLVIIRFINRLVNPPPPLPDTVPRWMRLAAKGSHVLLYALMFIMPLVGWGMLSAAPYPVVLYGTVHLPPILPQNAALYAWLRQLHTVLAYLLFATFLAHLGAALLHGLIRRDGVLESMASGGRQGSYRPRAPEKEMPATRCGSPVEQAERAFSINGAVRPQIPIAEGEKQFWRVVNASPDLYADLQIDSEQLEIAALDGMPLAFHNPRRHTKLADHILVPPAGRVEAIVTGPKAAIHAALRSLCFDTGPDGDSNAAMVLADLVDHAEQNTHVLQVSSRKNPTLYKSLSTRAIAKFEHSKPQFVATFTEDKSGFYINGKKYGPTGNPMTSVQVGSYRHWKVVNDTREVHPFHIHQVHFLAYAQNENPRDREWLDTVNVPAGGSVDLIMDFTDPIIRGVSLFHCHLLKHEDKGMMAKILFK